MFRVAQWCFEPADQISTRPWLLRTAATATALSSQEPTMQDVEDEPLFCERVAGLDIAKAGVEVTIRVPSDTTAGRRQQETRGFGTTRAELESLGDWLACWGVTRAGMEATSGYWKPVCFALESRGFDCQLYNAGQVKALPGRPKTDRADSIWLARITERGSVCSSFVPPEPIRRLRTHTRYRRHLTQARTAEKQRVEKLLEDGHLKLSSVIADIHGVSGRDMLDAIAAGQRDPKALAQLARGRMRGKIRRVEEALDCSFFTEEHAAVLAMMLAAIDHYTTQIQALTEKIEELAAPYLRQVQQPDAVPGIGQVCAQDIIAESGNPYLGAALGEATISAGRTQSFLGAKYRRLTRRMPKKKALVATGNSMLASIHALLSDPDASYQDLGADYYEHRMHVRRQARNHVLGLQRLGYQVTIQAVNPDTGELQAATA